MWVCIFSGVPLRHVRHRPMDTEAANDIKRDATGARAGSRRATPIVVGIRYFTERRKRTQVAFQSPKVALNRAAAQNAPLGHSLLRYAHSIIPRAWRNLEVRRGPGLTAR